jgi:hypothetical protein
MSHDEATSLDATLDIISDPEFYAEILRNRRALDRGEGRAYDLEELLGEVRDGRRGAATPARTKAKSPRGG